MREYLGEDICLAVRTPSQWRTLKSEEDFLQKKYFRLSLFDDGIQGSLTHLGTFGTMTKEAVHGPEKKSWILSAGLQKACPVAVR